MADAGVDKKLKLANTRKRFKELQELKKKRNGGNEQPTAPEQAANENDSSNSVQSSSRNTPVELKTHDNINIATSESALEPSQTITPQETVVSNGGFKEPNLPNYFGHFDQQGNAEFFDNISPANVPKRAHDKESPSLRTNVPERAQDDSPSSQTDVPERDQDDDSPSLLTYFNMNQDNEQSGPHNIGLPKYFDNINSSETIWENTIPDNQAVNKEDYQLFPNKREAQEPNNEEKEPIAVNKEDYQLFPNKREAQEPNNEEKEPIECQGDEDVLCQDYPEIKQNEISEYLRKSAENLALGPFPVTAQYNESNYDNIFSPIDSQKLMDFLGTTGATEEEKTDICHTNNEIDSSSDLTKKEIQHSNSENLRQLSDQLAHMIEPDYDYSTTGSITDLEKRNLELAAGLDKEKTTSEQLQAVNSELLLRIAQLETELTKQELTLNLQNVQETAQLKNELQTHLQTIGLLVAEKTELSSNLGQYEINSKQKAGECEELQARLRASRSRVADLERELNSLRSEKSKSDGVEEQYGATLENLRQEYKALKDQKDELAQDVLEVREKLKNTLEENVRLQQHYKDVSGKLSLAEIKIQQLSSAGALGVDSQVEQLAQEKFSLENELAHLNQTLKSIVKERDESTVQFQQYAQQLNAQISNLSSKLEQLQQEKENLVIQEQNRIKHLGELERQLQNLQNDQVTYATRNSSNSDLRNELEKSRELSVQLQIEKTTVEENYTKVFNEKNLLLKELEAKTDSILQLESMVEQLRGNQPDSVKLLATMESDKVAASRAIQQNKELKQQLEGMQEVVMKMDNDKVVLTENLKGQQQTNKELVEKLQKTELSLHSLADAIEIKDKELTHLRDAAEEINRQAIQHEQREDRLRHYEAHDNSAHIIQHELQEAQQTIAKLTSELHKRKPPNINEPSSSELEDARRTIQELTDEINKLKTSSQESKDGIVEAQEKNQTSTSIELAEEVDDLTAPPHALEDTRSENVLDKENAMKYLEEKVKRTMQEIADLSDEKQRLEHIVLQLQGETETIGEYVALYQHQRMVLKQKAVEKDQQLKQLTNDREQIKIKLDRLNELIRKLVTEKGAIPAELLQHQESMNDQANNFCEEHSKMNEEINRIKQTNVIEPESVVVTSHTAEEIITLLSEIKTSNLVTPDPNFNHCRWCSGQLMTV